MDIYSILSSKPHNSHYLKKYILFLHNCQIKNCAVKYTIKHHICPRKMFPMYINFRKHPWNCANLTHRQHFIAHILLWKAFPKNDSMTYAAWAMLHKDGHKLNAKLYERLMIEANSKTSKMNKCRTWVSKEGVSKNIHINELRDYVKLGWSKGRTFNTKHREKISNSAKERFFEPKNNPSYGITRTAMTNGDHTKYVRNDDVLTYLSKGYYFGVDSITKEKICTKASSKKIIFKGNEYSSIADCMNKTGESRYKIKQSAIELS